MNYWNKLGWRQQRTVSNEEKAVMNEKEIEETVDASTAVVWKGGGEWLGEGKSLRMRCF